MRVGESTDPPLSVRLADDLGDPVEGVPVRFTVLSGPGEMAHGLDVSNGQGVADETFVATSEFGNSRVRVDVPSASNVSPLEFRVLTLPASEVTLEKTGGTGQEAEVESQLPLPFQVEVTASSGVPAGGVAVVWEIAQGPSGARLSVDTTYTDDRGRSEALLTLGADPAPHVVRAYGTGGVASDTVRFRSASLRALSGPAVVDSVSPSPLAAGEEATLFGQQLGHRAEDVDVRVEGVSAEVLDAEPSRVRFRVPRFADRCLPRRGVGVRALVRGEPSNGTLVTLEPEENPLGLAPGEVRTLQGRDALGCVRLDTGGSSRAYYLVVGSTARSASAVVPMRLLLTAPEGEAPGGAGDLRASRSEASPSEGGMKNRFGPEVRIRESARRKLGGWRVVRNRSGSRADLRDATAGPPREGDTLSLRFPVGSDLSVSCSDTVDTVEAVVRSVGRHVVLAEDASAPSGGFRPGQFADLQREIDDTVFPSDTSYFGSPADIDGNERVIVLFTPRVNELGRGSGAAVSGFFLPLDLTDSGDPEGRGVRGSEGEICPASNEAELLYLRSPDPAGRHGPPFNVTEALRSARATTAHEMQHLLGAEQRIVLGDADFSELEEVWLAEAKAHVAEEAAGLKAMGARTGANLDWAQVARDRVALEQFNTYHLNNFARLSLFMQAPGRAPTLSGTDPGGAAGLQMRGFGWAFLRWAADRHAPDAEAEFFRELTRGGSGHLQGVANVERVTGARWEELIPDFLATLAVDDLEDAGTPRRLAIVTWDVRSVLAGLHEDAAARDVFPVPYPLRATPLRAESSSVDVEVAASAGDYFRLQTARDAPPVAFQLRSQGGGTVPATAAPYVTVVRTR